AFRFPNCVAQGTPTPVPSPTGTPPTVTPTATATPPLCPGGATSSGAITTSDPTQNGLLAADSVHSSCSAPKSYPGTLALGQFHYDAYTYTNTSGSAECVTVTLDTRACQTPLWSAAYLTSYNPADPSQNYLADPGRGNPVESYAFLVPVGATYVVVVNEIDA